MADENDRDAEAPGVVVDMGEAREVSVGRFAVVTVTGIPTAVLLNQIEADGFSIHTILGPMGTQAGVRSVVYVRRTSHIIRPAGGPVAVGN